MNQDILGGFVASLGGDENEYPANGKAPETLEDNQIEGKDKEEKLDPADIAKSFRKEIGADVVEKQDDEEEEIEDEDDDLEDAPEDEEEVEEEIVEKKPSRKTKQTTNDDDLIDDEASAAASLYSMLSEKMGIDIEEDDMPETIDGLIEKMYDIVEQNSVPTFANDEVAKINEFVSNGGKIADYFEKSSKYEVSENDLKTEDGRKRIVSKLLEYQGYSKEKIDKKIDKYDLAGILEDEAEDAYDKLEVIKQKSEEELLKQQRVQREEDEARQQKQYESVISTIKGLDEINGITISQKDKKELVKYLFEPTKSGTTKFTEDGKDIQKVVKAAFYMMNGASVIDTAKKKGKSDAYAKLKESLRSNKTTKSRAERFGNSMSSEEAMSVVSTGVNKLFGAPDSEF